MWEAYARNENKENTPSIIGCTYFTLNQGPEQEEENEYEPGAKVKR